MLQNQHDETPHQNADPQARPGAEGGSKDASRRKWTSFLWGPLVLLSLFIFVFCSVYRFTPVQPYATLPVHEYSHLFFSPDSSVLITAAIGRSSSTSAGPFRVWDVTHGIERFFLVADWKEIDAVCFSPDSRLIAAHEKGGDLKLWNAQTDEELASIKPTPLYGELDLRFSPDGQFLVFQDFSDGWPGHITFWDIDSKEKTGGVDCVFGTLAFATDGKSFGTLGRKNFLEANEVLLWKIDPSHHLSLVKNHPIAASEVAFSPDLRMFAAGNNMPDGSGEVVLWDMDTGAQRFSLRFDEEDTGLMSLSFEAGGRILAAYCGTGPPSQWRWRTTLWDVTSTPRELGSFSGRPAVSPNGEWLAIEELYGAKLFKVSTLEEKHDLTNKNDEPPQLVKFLLGSSSTSSTFSPDGTTVAISRLNQQEREPMLNQWLPPKLNPFPRKNGESVVRLWEVATGQELMAFDDCREAHYSLDGKVLATIQEDETINLWRLPCRKPLWQVFGRTVLFWMPALLLALIGMIRRRIAPPR